MMITKITDFSKILKEENDDCYSHAHTRYFHVHEETQTKGK